MSRYYYWDRDTGAVVKASSFEEWIEWAKDVDPTLASDTIDGVEVHTAFIFFDHSFDPSHVHLFETMAWDGDRVLGMWRYPSQTEALEGHQRILEAIKEGYTP